MKQRLSMFLVSMFCFVAVALAQTEASGIVVFSDDGEPVVGASVKVVGSTIGMATDMNGRFSLNVPGKNSVLEISYVGMQTKTVKAGKNMRIELVSNDDLLDEVMVVAFGTQKKSAFTGSAAVVGAEEISKKITSNVTDALVGSVAGLQMRGATGAPGSGSGSINIRGIASMYSATDPLVIVDGAPYPASLSNINPDDVESITVLKDAASAALYGARGAAGVILVTTKKGQMNKTSINVDMKWGANTRAVQDYDKINDPGQWYETYYAQLYNKYYYNDGMSAADANAQANARMLKDVTYNVFTYPENETLIGMDGKLNPNATLGRKYTGTNGVDYWLQPDDWNKEAYSSALRQEYTLNMSGANDRGSFYLSGGYLNEDGIIKPSSYERITARLKADYQLRKWLKVGANIGFVNSKTTSNPNMDASLGSTNVMYYTSSIAPIYPVYIRTMQNGVPTIMTDENGNPAYDYGIPANDNRGYRGLNRTFLSTGNPLGSNHYNNVYSKGNQLNATFNADVMLTSYLKFSAVSNVNLGMTNFSDYENMLYGPKEGVNGDIYKSNTTSLRTNNTQTLNYFKDFDKHNVSAMIGHEYYHSESSYLNASANGGFSPSIQEINAFANKYDAASYTTGYNIEGYFANANYNYDEKYFGSASFRRDASSRFKKENRWGSFWSLGGAWIMSKEDFMANTSNWLDMLKVKASVGQQGNDGIGNWAYIDLYSLSANATNTGMTPSFSRLGNSDITWETTTNINAGVEFEFFKRRLRGSIDVYTKKTTDLLFWLSIPESSGTRGYYGNMGDIRNTGIELVLGVTPVKNRLVTWNINGNISHNKTKILSLPEAKVGENGGFTESSMWYEVGKPLYNGFYRESGIDEQGKVFFYQDTDLYDKKNDKWNTSKPGQKRDAITYDPNEASKYEYNLLPKLSGGLATDITVGKFDASLTFDFQIGGKIYDTGYAALMSNSADATGAAFHKDVLKSWTPNNTESNIPRWQYGDQYTTSASSRFLTNASYLNFQSFQIGYTLPKFSKEVSRARVYVAGENICFWSARKGLDPRFSYQSNNQVGAYYAPRNISGGVQITF